MHEDSSASLHNVSSSGGSGSSGTGSGAFAAGGGGGGLLNLFNQPRLGIDRPAVDTVASVVSLLTSGVYEQSELNRSFKTYRPHPLWGREVGKKRQKSGEASTLLGSRQGEDESRAQRKETKANSTNRL